METFDYVIVGGGSAGCVVAARLSEDPATRVLLLEAGPRDLHPAIHIPAAFPRLFKSGLDWAYQTEPQPSLGGRSVYWPRGRVLGGSSALNAMMWVRGFPADYDGWAERAGPGWSYASLLPYFRRAEDTEGAAPDDPARGTGGPLAVSHLRDPNPLTGAWLRAAGEAGIGPLDAVGDGEGVTETMATQRGGRRVSTADAYLHRAMRRRNLVVRTRVRCTGIVFEGRRAVGVSYLRGRDPLTVTAARGVVLAAGSIGSPQLLMCSGVGPALQLSALGIRVVVDSPQVGQNLQDHLISGIAARANRRVTLAGAQSLASLARYLLRHRGMLTSTVAEAYGFVRSDPAQALPDLELLFLPVLFVDEGLKLPTEHGVTLAAVLLQPDSSGVVHLRSPDPSVPPVVDPWYLSDPEERDAERLRAGIRWCRRILAQPSLAKELGELYRPAGLDGEELVEAALRDLSQTLYHPVGTCRMGKDPGSVVDPELRVRGVDGLRVVDASVMPRIIRGHTHAPTVAIAERAAELIRAGL